MSNINVHHTVPAYSPSINSLNELIPCIRNGKSEHELVRTCRNINSDIQFAVWARNMNSQYQLIRRHNVNSATAKRNDNLKIKLRYKFVTLIDYVSSQQQIEYAIRLIHSNAKVAIQNLQEKFANEALNIEWVQLVPESRIIDAQHKGAISTRALTLLHLCPS